MTPDEELTPDPADLARMAQGAEERCTGPVRIDTPEQVRAWLTARTEPSKDR